MDALIDTIKNTVNPSDIIGKRVKLRSNGREFVGLSPFTNEKTASFTVNNQKGFYHDFSSGEHGDVIDFIMKFENVSFKGAVKIICDEYGIEDTEQHKTKYKSESVMVACIRDALQFYRDSLYSPCGASAREYLRSRGLSKSIIDDFKIGFAPNSFQDTKNHLASKGYSEKVMSEVGLIIKDDGKSWDKFRNRIMFPIHNHSGTPVAFGGRTLSVDKEAKYINSPETPIFKKREILYNLPKARRSLRNSNENIMIVEGYMDVISLSSYGLNNCVSPMGTSITDEHMDCLWSVSPEPIVCMDGDRAGRQASYRIADNSFSKISHNKTLRFLFLKDDLDPDDYILKYGIESFKEQVEDNVSLVELLWEREKNLTTLNTPERKVDLKSRLFHITESIENKDLRYNYRRHLLKLYDEHIKGGWRVKINKNDYTLGINMDTISQHEEIIVGIPIFFPECFENVVEHIKSIKLKTLSAEIIRSSIVKCIENEVYSNIDECVYMNIDEQEVKYLENIKKKFNIPLTKQEAFEVWKFSYDLHKKSTG